MHCRATICGYLLVEPGFMTSKDVHQCDGDDTVREGASAKTCSYERAYLLRQERKVLEHKAIVST